MNGVHQYNYMQQVSLSLNTLTEPEELETMLDEFVYFFQVSLCHSQSDIVGIKYIEYKGELNMIKNSVKVLIIMSSLMNALFFSSTAISADKSSQICDEKKKYIVRRLASEQEDNFCAVYKGQMMLVVNTASRCAYTDQYDELEKLYAEYKDRGLVVIGFPSNDFGSQEPGSEQKIKNFCRLTYGVEFPMYAKTRVTGNNVHPLYKKLAEVSGQVPQWNFHKYLINRNGKLVGSYRSSVNPYNSKIIKDIEKNL